jgi:hypothetical protein
MGEMRNAYKIMGKKSEGRWPFGRPGRRWQDDIKMYFSEMQLEGVDWSDLAQDRGRWWALVNTVMNPRVP